MDMYRNHVNLNELKDTVVKLLLRCAYSYECIERCKIIFKMHKRHSKLLASLGLDGDKTKADIDKKSQSSKGSNKKGKAKKT